MSAEGDAAAAARKFRAEHHLGTQPLGDLVALIDQTTRIDVAVVDVSADEHGMLIRDPARDTVFIGVAATDRPMRQRSTLAHELGHVLFHDRQGDEAGDWSHRSFEETRADAFARHLLVPVEGLRDQLAEVTTVSEAMLSDIVQRFLVSPVIVAIALRSAGYIDERAKTEWMGLTTPKLAAKYGWLDQYRALQVDSAKPRTPQRLLARAIAGYRVGVVSAQAIATLRRETLADAEAYLREAGIETVEPDVRWMSLVDLPDVDVDLSELDRDLASDGFGDT